MDLTKFNCVLKSLSSDKEQVFTNEEPLNMSIAHLCDDQDVDFVQYIVNKTATTSSHNTLIFQVEESMTFVHSFKILNSQQQFDSSTSSLKCKLILKNSHDRGFTDTKRISPKKYHFEDQIPFCSKSLDTFTSQNALPITNPYNTIISVVFPPGYDTQKRKHIQNNLKISYIVAVPQTRHLCYLFSLQNCMLGASYHQDDDDSKDKHKKSIAHLESKFSHRGGHLSDGGYLYKVNTLYYV